MKTLTIKFAEHKDLHKVENRLIRAGWSYSVGHKTLVVRTPSMGNLIHYLKTNKIQANVDYVL